MTATIEEETEEHVKIEADSEEEILNNVKIKKFEELLTIGDSPINVIPMIDSIQPETLENFKFYIERYYEFKYCITFPKVGNLDTCIRVHTNKILVVSLADGHEIIRKNKDITKVTFEINDKVNRSINSFAGKGKKGAQKLEPTSILCYITCSDETTYPVYSGVYGKLAEVNEEIVKEPLIIINERKGIGFIAVIIPDLNKWPEIESQLLNEQQYLDHLKSTQEINN